MGRRRGGGGGQVPALKNFTMCIVYLSLQLLPRHNESRYALKYVRRYITSYFGDLILFTLRNMLQSIRCVDQLAYLVQ